MMSESFLINCGDPHAHHLIVTVSGVSGPPRSASFNHYSEAKREWCVAEAATEKSIQSKRETSEGPGGAIAYGFTWSLNSAEANFNLAPGNYLSTDE